MARFAARERFEFTNGAIGWRPGGPMDCLGPFAKVQNCPIDGTALRLTCYATSYADTFFSVPACTRYRGHYIGGFFTCEQGSVKFVPTSRYQPLLEEVVLTGPAVCARCNRIHENNTARANCSMNEDR